MKSIVLFVAICALLSGCSGLLPSPVRRFAMQTPRPFGYMIGDEVHHRVLVETRPDMSLNLSSVPAQGEVNRWLNIERVTVSRNHDGRETVIDLNYQIFYAPAEVKMLTIPGFTLQFTQAGKTVEQAVPEWHFTLSPLQELALRKDDDGYRYRRPDALPRPLPTQNQWIGIYTSLTSALFAGAYLAYLYGYFPMLARRRIFKRASRQLANLTAKEMGRALAVVHNALNILNGHPLFPHQLNEFYGQHPEYRTAKEQIDWFFNFSNRVLFAGWQEYGMAEWEKLNGLCRLCREIERGSR